MQINSNASIDPALVSASISNQIDVAVAVRARQVQQQQGEAMVELVENAADISEQIQSGHIDVRL